MSRSRNRLPAKDSAGRELFAVVTSGAVKINQTDPLREAAQVHADLESRNTTGSTVFAALGLGLDSRRCGRTDSRIANLQSHHCSKRIADEDRQEPATVRLRPDPPLACRVQHSPSAEE